MLKRVHHINLLVRDLDAAIERYQSALGVERFVMGDLQARGVKTARFLVGESWIVLVEPIDPNGVPARHLAEHGEGLFLLSFEVENLAVATNACESGGGAVLNKEPRQGLENWQLVDLDSEAFFGASLQLVTDTE